MFDEATAEALIATLPKSHDNPDHEARMQKYIERASWGLDIFTGLPYNHSENDVDDEDREDAIEQRRRDEKNGLYGRYEDASN